MVVHEGFVPPVNHVGRICVGQNGRFIHVAGRRGAGRGRGSSGVEGAQASAAIELSRDPSSVCCQHGWCAQSVIPCIRASRVTRDTYREGGRRRVAGTHLIADLGIVNYDCAEPSATLRRAVFCNQQSCAALGKEGTCADGSRAARASPGSSGIGRPRARLGNDTHSTM